MAKPKLPELDIKYLQLEDENAKLHRDIKQLTDDNKLMWDLWKQVQTTKPDITQIIALTVERESKKYAAKEKHVWALVEEKELIVKRLEELAEAREREINCLSAQVAELKTLEVNLKNRNQDCASIEEKLNDEIDRLNKQLVNSDDVNNRLLVSMEKENMMLKDENDALKHELCANEKELTALKSGFEAANNSSNTLWSEMASYRQMVNIMETELAALRNDCAELRTSFNNKCEELECAMATNEKCINEINDQSRLTRELQFQVDQLFARNKELESEIATQRIDADERHAARSPIAVPPVDVEILMSEVGDLKEQLVRVTKAYEAKAAEAEVLRRSVDERMNVIEQLHCEQRAIHDGLDGLDHRLRKEGLKDACSTKENADVIQQMEASLETERLIALLKQHCRELANDRDVFAARMEKALVQLANRESCIADLKLRLANLKRDRDSEIRKLSAEHGRRVDEISKQQSGKLSSELAKQKSETASLEKKLQTALSEKRRLRASLSACQARLSRESGLSARLQDRICELERSGLMKDAKLSASRGQLAEQNSVASRRRRTRSASCCSQEDSPPRQKKKILTFDMATQTDDVAFSSEKPASPVSSCSNTFSISRNSRRTSGFAARQQLAVERMRVSRLLRLAADLKTDRMKLRHALGEEQQSRMRFEAASASMKSQLSMVTSANKQLESRLAGAEADAARLKKVILDYEQRCSEQQFVSPRVDKSVITDEMESASMVTSHVSVEMYEELKQRLAAMLITEREQASRLAHFQVECDRLQADLALAKERLNDARREVAKDRRNCEEQRDRLRILDLQASSDAVRIKELSEKLASAEHTDKSVGTRIVALKRRVDESESEKASLLKRLEDKRTECDRAIDQAKKAKTRCQYLEVLLTSEKNNCSRIESGFKEEVKKFQLQLSHRSLQLDEFKRFIEALSEMLLQRIKHDRHVVGGCERSNTHNRQQRQSSSPRHAVSQTSEAVSISSRAASIAQTHLKLSASEAAELLMIGSVDASPTPNLVFDSPEAFFRKVNNILRQIFDSAASGDDSTQFANRLCDAFFNGFVDHLRFLLSRPSCCQAAVNSRDDRSAFGDRRHTVRANSSTVGMSDSVFSGSPY